jgi:hypothetical protein
VLRSDWDSIQDVDRNKFPGLTLDSLLGEKYLMTFGSASDAEAETFRMSYVSGVGRESLPLCGRSVDGLMNGSWVRSVPLANMFGPRDPPHTSRPKGQFRAYFTDMRREVVWVPYECRRQPWPVNDVSACLNGKRVVFRGDSQTRTLYEYFTMKVCGVNMETKGVVGQYDYVGEPGLCPNTCLLYVSETHPTSGPRVEDVVEVDILVTNFGHWLADVPRYTTVREYGKRVKHVLSEVGVAVESVNQGREKTNGGRGKVRVVWTENHPFPVRNDYDVWHYQDLRTPSRLELFNRVSNEVVEGLVVDEKVDMLTRLYDMLWTVVDISTDNAHLGVFDAGYSVVMEGWLSAWCGNADVGPESLSAGMNNVPVIDNRPSVPGMEVSVMCTMCCRLSERCSKAACFLHRYPCLPT